MSEVARSRIGIAVYVTPASSLDADSAVSALRDSLDECIAAREVHVVVDLGRVVLLSSEALEVLLDYHERMLRLGGEVKLAQCSAVVRDVLMLTGLDRRLPVMEELSKGSGGVVTPLRPAAPMRLGERLVSKGYASEEQVAEAIRKQSSTGRRLGRILLELGHVTERELLGALSEQLSLPLLRLRTGLYDPRTVTTLNRSLAVKNQVVPLFSVRGELFVATADPQDIPSLDLVEEVTGQKVHPVLAVSEDILATINDGFGDDHDLSGFIGNLDTDDEFELLKAHTDDSSVAIDEMASGSPVINLVNGLIQRAVRDGVSDIHIEPLRNRCQIRFRIDGLLYPAMSPPAEIHPALVSRLKVMANLDIAERRLPQDGRIQVYTHGRTIDLRFSSLPGLFGEKVVLRVLDKMESVTDIEKLGMAPDNMDTYKGLLSRSNGLVLVTGPTGSGKTTSLYAALSYLNTPEKSIVTIEDPVEYQLDLINQNQVRENVGLGFAKVLKHVLRQDPDIIMVGEIREQHTAEIAVQAALTGHLVLSTLHTNDAAGAISRLLDMGVEPFLLSSALIGVVAQRLVRTICPQCRATYEVPGDALARYGIHSDARMELARGSGCPACYDSGYKGRMAIHEILVPDGETQDLMLDMPSRDALTEHMRRRGTRSLQDDGIQRVIEQRTTVEEVTRVVNT